MAPALVKPVGEEESIHRMVDPAAGQVDEVAIVDGAKTEVASGAALRGKEHIAPCVRRTALHHLGTQKEDPIIDDSPY